MADYIVKDTELTSVANAIRTAGGTNSLLSFPNGFVSAVGNISGGAGLVVHVIEPENPEYEGQKALDKTFAEIHAAIESGVPITFVRIDEVIMPEATVEQIFLQTLMSLEHVYANDTHDTHECVVMLVDSQTNDQQQYFALGLNEQLKLVGDY